MGQTYTPPPEFQGYSFHNVLPPHQAALLLPRMSPKARRELAEDIKANGLQTPVVIYVDAEGKRSLLDGISRLEAMQLIGLQVVQNGALNPTVVEYQEIRDVDPTVYVLSANLHRRHLALKDKRQLAANLLQMFPGRSDRQIAEMVGLSHPTVKDVRSELERCGKIFHVERRLDTRGRRQVANKSPKLVSPPPASSTPLTSVAPAPEAIKTSALKSAHEEIGRLGREVRSLLQHPTPDNIEGVQKRVARIIRLADADSKVSAKVSKAPASKINLDLGAFGRAVGHAA
jgi:ParB-like chromosome segregation protein Spo0J